MTDEVDYWLSTTTTNLKSRQHVAEHVAELFGIATSKRAEHGLLWRAELDKPTGLQRLLIQSAVPPLDGNDVETKPVHDWFARLQEGVRVQYRIHLCPCVRYNQPERRGDLRLGVRNAQTRWSEILAPKAGLKLDINQIRSRRFEPPLPPHYNAKRPQYLPIDQYDGQAIITEPEQLRAAILNGIGPYKGFGNGLLSLSIVHHTQKDGTVDSE